jgi:triosephosphate isomerase
MSRRPLIAGNWKMFRGPVEADALAAQLKRALVDVGSVDVAVAPPFLSIPAVVSRLKHSGVQVGGQNLHAEVQGAFTGEISGEMLKQSGCSFVLVGHSERRTLFGETDAVVQKKLAAALRAQLTPLLCVGETLSERDAGQVDAVVTRQLHAAYGALGAEQAAQVVIAYEPVWAIGTGRTASADQAQAVHATIRGWLAARYPAWLAAQSRVLYGGSVKAGNATSLLSQPDIDGALVGGASLDADEFVRIIQAAGAR